MGIPSMGIYSYELFDKYNVEYIIRIGTAGSYTEELDVYDTVLVDECYSESTYAYCQSLEKTNIEKPSLQLNKAILETAKKMGRKLTVAKAHSSDVYKREEKAKVLVNDAIQKEKCKCVEMESYALFHNAKVLNKQSACLLTISDSMVSKKKTTSEEREKLFINMIEIALETALEL